MNKFFLLCLIGLCLLGCSNLKDKEAKVGSLAPKISAKTLEGKSIGMDQIPQNLRVIVFFQGNCGACLKELPLLNQFAKVHQEHIAIIAINSVDSQEKIAYLQKQYALDSLSVLKDNVRISYQRFKIYAFPTMVVIKDGVIIERIIGERPWSEIEKKLLGYIRYV